jgi:UDP-N-acetylmuramate dehydrogenase
VIHLVSGGIEVKVDEVIVDAGVLLARLVATALAKGLSGIEWAIGIPGSLGGSIRGNAGCFGGEMKDVVETIRVYDTKRGEEFVLPGNAAEFGYRDSIFKRHPEWVILSATVKLFPGDTARSQALIREYATKRTAAQAIGSKSCGCIFKNIPWGRKGISKEKILMRFPGMPPSGTVDGIPVSYLISEAGLKGRRIGDIEVSQRHANYFVNHGNGTADEVAMLIALVKEYVHRTFGLVIEEEIQYVGF